MRTLRRFVACLVFLPIFANARTIPASEPENLHLFLLAGQSNMAGRGKIDAAQNKPHDRILMLNKAGDWVPATDPLHFDKPGIVGVGLARTFAQTLVERDSSITIGLIPCAVGGSSISTWEPGGYHKQTKSSPFDDTLKRLKIARRAGEVKAILWHQGESDSTAKNAPQYQERLDLLISRLRQASGGSEIPFLVGQLGQFEGKPWNEHRQQVDAAHRSLPDRISATAFISSKGLTDKGDQTHFSADSYRELGRRYASAFLSLESKNASGEYTFASSDWPWWRGPDRNGHADEHQQPPTKWSSNENILWKRPLPGRGHGSPIVVGEYLYLPTADRKRKVQTVLCLHRDTGEVLWETIVHRGGIMKKNQKASQASSTLACDGQRLFVNFLNDGAVYTTALTRDGQQQWQHKICDYVIHQGYASSPAIYKDLVIVSADTKHRRGGAIVALDRETGEERWRKERPSMPNYPSPVVLTAAGRTQVILTGCKLVSSFDPATGRKLWEIEGATTECVTSTVTDGTLVFSSGGYPDNHVAAIHADGSGKVAWRNGDRVYVPSMLLKDGYLYAILDAGIAVCWKADTGEEQWKKRLGGTFSSSPVLVGDHIYAIDENAEMTIFAANPGAFEKIAVNKLDGDSFATPTIAGDRVYLRIGTRQNDERQEMLYCIGQ
ncbi:MAG: sialate O-acetylesterase [Planctomycetota bacterium]